MANREAQMDRTRGAMFEVEHWAAWLMVLAALVLAAVGILRGLGQLGEVADAAGVDPADVQFTTQFMDGLLWLLPAFAAALLAAALHNNDHHRTMPMGRVESRDSGLYGIEHLFAWLIALGTMGAGALCLLVGFDVFDNGNTAQDGLIWGMASLVGGASTLTLHAVRHHQLATEEDYLVAIVEERTRIAPMGTTRTEPMGRRTER